MANRERERESEKEQEKERIERDCEDKTCFTQCPETKIRKSFSFFGIFGK
jgi:hypothetical protein